MGESLVLSWLRHVQKCMLVQLNWKPSPVWELAGEHELAQDFNAIRSFVDQEMGVRIFKNVSFQQFIRQAEIDALGFRFDRDAAAPVGFAVDSAFHENGLQYGDFEETVARVLKKLVRSAFVCRAYFRTQQLHLVFATPKMHAVTRKAIEQHLATLVSSLLARWALSPGDIRLRVVANEDFAKEILQPVLRCAGTVADTSELFLRAQQLLVLCGTIPSEREIQPRPSNPERRESGEKIGVHVRLTMDKLAKSGRLTPEVITNLLNTQYCKMTFNIGYALLKKVDPQTCLNRQRTDDRGYARFWKAPIAVGGEQFLMCSQWFPWQRGPFDTWVRQLADDNDTKNLPPKSG